MKRRFLLALFCLSSAASALAAENRVAASLVSDGLVAHWKLDTPALTDSGPHAIHGKLNGSASFPDTSIGGHQMNLNGSDSFVRATNDAFTSLDDHFSIAFFVRPYSVRNQPLISRHDAAKKSGWLLEQRADMGFQLRAPGAAAVAIAPPNTLVRGRWGHVVATVAPAGQTIAVRLYVNARPVATNTLPRAAFSAETTGVLLGAHHGNPVRFHGGFDEFYLFNRALKADEIKTLFRPGSRFDYEPLAKVKFEAATLKPGRVANELLPAEPKPPFKDGKFVLEPNNTVVFIGGGNLEAESKHAQIEARLTAAHPKHKLRFRNVAWEGDTVYEQWRDVNFGKWAQQLAYLKADVVFVQFGQMEALDGKVRIPEFTAAYEKLLDEFEKQTKRIVLMSPTAFGAPEAKSAPPLYNRNNDLQAYVKAIKGIAAKRGLVFVDLFLPKGSTDSKQALLRGDGIHLNEGGHFVTAIYTKDQLGYRDIDLHPIDDSLLDEILEKNRLWQNYWRPMNYAFAFGDRTHVAFGKGEPSFREELEAWRPFLETAEARIDAVATGKTELPKFPPVRERAHSVIAKLTAEEQIASFTVREDLQANLFASEADGIFNPVQMRWD
ncbi:MAG: hypothetical protein ACI8QF_003986, partial [Limisphaerales bacterium]